MIYNPIKRHSFQVSLLFLLLTAKLGLSFSPQYRRQFGILKYTSVGIAKNAESSTFPADEDAAAAASASVSATDSVKKEMGMDSSEDPAAADDGDNSEEMGIELSKVTTEPTSEESGLALTGRKMDLMWCDRDRCKDVVRERLVGEHNQIVLNGPATGQVAYRWSGTAPTGGAVSSVLLLVKPNDENLIQTVAEAVPLLTAEGIRVLLAPDLAAKLKYYFGVDDDRISLFEEPSYSKNENRRDRHVYDDEQEWVQDMDLEPFPDLICTLGGDGLLMHASMLFQGPIPPVISIAGGSLGFLTSFSVEEMVEAVGIALGVVTGELSDDTVQDELQVFPPNMYSYPYEPPIKTPHMNGGTPNVKFGLGGIICMTIRMRLDCRVVSPEGKVRDRYNVLNEVVIDRGSSPYLAALECFCDDVHLTTVQADGIIFATPTGSTAYSMSAGGSVVHPAVPCILVTPICPHVLSFRSMVFPDHVIVRCYVPDDARSHASVAFDGKHRQELQRGDSVQIQMSAYPVPTINRGDHSSDWLESLKRSFNFNTRPRQRPL